MTYRFPHALLAILLTAAGAHSAAADFAGRGVFAFNSASGCPLEALAGKAADCNHLALDNIDTRASVDSAAHTIRFSNVRNYASKTIVGDVLLQGSGVDAGGQRVPLSFHVVLSKKGQQWSASSHAHAPVRGDFSAIQIDAYQIETGAAGAASVLLAPAKISETLASPGLATRLANQLVQVTDNRTKDARDADITIGLGAAGLSKSLIRASLHTAPLSAGNVDTLPMRGTWSFDLEALTGQIPDGVAERELFLYGLDQQPLLKPLMERGFKKNEKLTVGAVDGKGYVRYGGKQEDFAGADAAARAFLQQSFMGLVLGWLQTEGVPGAR